MDGRPCKGGVSPFDISEIQKYLKKVDGWDVKKNNDEFFFLEKEFKFNNFLESQKFTNEVGNISEAQGHHPDILSGWGYAKIKKGPSSTSAYPRISVTDFQLKVAQSEA